MLDEWVVCCCLTDYIVVGFCVELLYGYDMGVDSCHPLQEIEFLTSSIGQLKVAQTKYVDAKDSLNVLNKNNKGK